MTTTPPEVKKVTQQRIHCDGGEGPLGHPRVYLTIGKDGTVTCPYCDRLFVYEGPALAAGH